MDQNPDGIPAGKVVLSRPGLVGMTLSRVSPNPPSGKRGCPRQLARASGAGEGSQSARVKVAEVPCGNTTAPREQVKASLDDR
jgi:hypothetical protein